MNHILNSQQFIEEKLDIEPISRDKLLKKSEKMNLFTKQIVTQICELAIDNKDCFYTNDSLWSICIDYEIPKRFGMSGYTVLNVYPYDEPFNESNVELFVKDSDEDYIDEDDYTDDVITFDKFRKDEQKDILDAYVFAIHNTKRNQ